MDSGEDELHEQSKRLRSRKTGRLRREVDCKYLEFAKQYFFRPYKSVWRLLRVCHRTRMLQTVSATCDEALYENE